MHLHVLEVPGLEKQQLVVKDENLFSISRMTIQHSAGCGSGSVCM